jgi:hypothetical protein
MVPTAKEMTYMMAILLRERLGHPVELISPLGSDVDPVGILDVMQGCPNANGTATAGSVCEQHGYPDMVVEVLDVNLYVDLGIASGAYVTTGITNVPYTSTRARVGIYTIEGGPRRKVMYDWDMEMFGIAERFEEIQRITKPSPPSSPTAQERCADPSSKASQALMQCSGKSCDADGVFRPAVICETLAPIYNASCKPIYVPTAYQSMCTIEGILDLTYVPYYVVYIDDLDLLIRECAWKETPAVFMAIDPHVRYLESEGVFRQELGFAAGNRGDYLPQKIFKVRNDRLLDGRDYEDAIAFFDSFEVPVDQQTALRSAGYLAQSTTESAAYTAACEWLQDEANEETWAKWIVCTDCSDACKAEAVAQPDLACLQVDWNDGVCNAECNSRACGHNDCMYTQIHEKCTLENEAIAIDFRASPTRTELDAFALAMASAAAAAAPASTEESAGESEGDGGYCTLDDVGLCSGSRLLHGGSNADQVGSLTLCWEHCFFMAGTQLPGGLGAIGYVPDYLGTDQNACYCYETCPEFSTATLFGLFSQIAAFPRHLPVGYSCNLPPAPPLPPSLPPASPPPHLPPPPSPSDENQLVDVNFQLSLSSAARLEISEELNEMKLFQELYYVLEWEDPRIAESPCFQILSNNIGVSGSMLSISFEEGQDDQTRATKQANREMFWMPSPNPSQTAPGYDFVPEVIEFEYYASKTWYGYDSECRGCAVDIGEVDLDLLQGFDYTLYPFDRQVITINFEVEGANLFSCNGTQGLAHMALENMSWAEAQAALLPATNTWTLDGHSLGSEWGRRQLEEFHAVSLTHPTDSNGVPIPSQCTMSIKIRREFVTYVIKRLITDILVVFMGLFWSPDLVLEPQTDSTHTVTQRAGPASGQRSVARPDGDDGRPSCGHHRVHAHRRDEHAERPGPRPPLLSHLGRQLQRGQPLHALDCAARVHHGPLPAAEEHGRRGALPGQGVPRGPPDGRVRLHGRGHARVRLHGRHDDGGAAWVPRGLGVRRRGPAVRQV